MTTVESAFLSRVAPAAIASEQATGVPAAITIAQSVLESGWGRTGLAIQANNYFGIKAKQGEDYIEFPTAEYESGKRVMIYADFAKYPTVEAGFVAHGRLLSTLPRYAPAMNVKSDLEKFAEELQKCGYSTSPMYAHLLMELVWEFNLWAYRASPAAV